MTEKKGQIVELGAVRGIAALMVLMGHSLILYGNPEWFHQPTLLFNGRGAVVVFFVLSGFVLTHSLAGRDISTPNLVGFYIKRLFRLFPAIWAASALSLVYLTWVHFRVASPDASVFFHERFRPERFNLLFIIASLAGMSAFLLPQLWSIFVELVASALMPFIAFAAYKRTTLFCVWALVALAASFTLNFVYYNLMLYLFDFFVGAAIAVIPTGLRSLLASPRLPTGLIAYLVTAGLITSQYLPLSYYSPFAALYEAVLAATLISLLVYSKLDLPALRSRVAVYLGDISYSVYLLHFTVACFMMKGLDALQNANNLVISTEVKSLIVVSLAIMITIPLAHFCYQYIELPGIQMGKWFGRQASVRLNEGILLPPVESQNPKVGADRA